MTTDPSQIPTLPQAIAAVEDLRNAHRELLHVVDSLSDSDWERPVPYGDWTVRDLIAYLIGDMSPSGPGLILAGVLTPEYIANTSKAFDVRTRNQSMVDERRRFTKEDLRQLLFESHDARITATLRLTEQHLPVLQYAVPMGPNYELRVEDWLWYGYHDRHHTDDIRRAVAIDYEPEQMTFQPEIEATFGAMHRYRDGFLRAVYSVADDAWDEPSRDVPGWTYRDILAHTAANDLRMQARLKAVLGEGDEAELQALMDTDAWNQREIDNRRGRTVRELVDELKALRHETLCLLSRFGSDHIKATVRHSEGSVDAITYIQIPFVHESIHAGHLVPASRARWKLEN